VNIDAPKAWDIEHRLRQDQTVSDHDHDIGLETGQFGYCFRIAQLQWLLDR
jgi:hypothetical protein